MDIRSIKEQDRSEGHLVSSILKIIVLALAAFWFQYAALTSLLGRIHESGAGAFPGVWQDWLVLTGAFGFSLLTVVSYYGIIRIMEQGSKPENSTDGYSAVRTTTEMHEQTGLTSLLRAAPVIGFWVLYYWVFSTLMKRGDTAEAAFPAVWQDWLVLAGFVLLSLLIPMVIYYIQKMRFW